MSDDNNPFVVKTLREKEYQTAAEKAADITRDALALARACRKSKDGTEPSKDTKAMASVVGQRAADLRKEAKEKLEEYASARRIACYKAMPKAPPPPPFVLPLKPPPSPKKEED